MLAIVKKLAWFWLIFAISPIFLWYFTSQCATALWCWAWLVVWAVFIHSKADELTRGMAFIVASVFVVFAGKYFLGKTEHAEIIELVQNTMLLVAGGVGGNFMAAYLLRQSHEPKQPSK